MKDKIGVGITTYNSESYYKALYESLPLDKIDCLVTVNGGDKYQNNYAGEWIQHTQNKYPSACRNECVNHLLEQGCEHIFIIEDDMIILNPNIFDEYINASKKTGLKYLCFTSISFGSGAAHNRTPKVIIDYPTGASIAFYQNMCNEFTYHHRSAFLNTGLYDANMRDAFDVDMAYRESKENYSSLFWWFADIVNADNFIMNNPNAISRMAADRPDGSRSDISHKIWEYFYNKHQIKVNNIPIPSLGELKIKLKQIYDSKD